MIILQLWNFTCCFFSFFLNIRTIYQLIYQRLFYSKPLFYSKTSFLFYAKPHFLCEFYAPLSSFFLFLHFVQISNMDDNTNYQEDYEEDLLSDIFPLQEQTSGRKKSHVWDHYETRSEEHTSELQSRSDLV